MVSLRMLRQLRLWSVFGPVLLLTFMIANVGHASDLAGGTAAARPSAKTATTNPAHAAELPRTTFEAAPMLFRSETTRIRYVGSEPIEKSNAGLGSLTSFAPAFIWKVNPRLGVGITEILPPISINTEVKDAPINLLGQVNKVNLAVEAISRGGLGGLVGYTVSDRFSIGLKAGFRAYGANIVVTPSEGGAALATIKLVESTFNMEAGFSWEVIEDKVDVGAVAGLFAMKSTKQSIDSPLLGAAGEGAGGPGAGGASSSAGVPLSGILFGTALRFGENARVYLDIDWRRNPPSKEFSLVEFREKDRDLYDTVAVRTGIALSVLPNGGALLGGFRYEPSPIGAGGRGADSKSGFGAREVIEMSTGLGELQPYWMIAGGARWNFGKSLRVESSDAKGSDKAGREGTRSSGRKGERRRGPTVTQYSLGGGVAWQKASLGIDENGELPGAFTQTRLSLPIEFSWRF